MELTTEQLQSFINLYQSEFGITLTKEQAQEKASSLLYFMSLCMKPLAKFGEDDIVDMPNAS